MKKIYRPVLMSLALLLLKISASAQINFPDENFRSVLFDNYGITFDNTNNITNPEVAAAVNELDVQAQGISSLAGIEAFTGLRVLDCVFNNLTSLDLSSNLELSTLLCDYNQIETLIISENTELSVLSCDGNPLSGLDVAKNQSLTYLSCHTSDLTQLNVSENPLLTHLDCGGNPMDSLDVSTNNLLEYLNINSNLSPFTLGVWTEDFPPNNLSFLNTENPAKIVFGALPVEMIAFAVIGNKLKWSTATETNNAGWEIEERQLTNDNGQSESFGFRKVGFVQGKGTTTEEHSYSFSIQPSASRMEYRLKQLDSDGKFSYTKILTVEPAISAFSLSQNYPNPFNPTTKIRYQVPENSPVKIIIFDMLGREIKTLVSNNVYAGQHDVTFDASSLPSGIYIYKLIAGNFSETKKMMLVK